MLFNKLLLSSRKLISSARNISYVPKNRLDGKVAIVTASTEGIGYGIAERLGLEGAKVVISSRKQKNVDAAIEKLKSQKIEATGLVCHVGNPQDRNKLFKETLDKFGGLNILVSNAAVNPTVGGVLDCEEQSWDKVFDINVKSAYMLAKDSLPHLRKNKGGKIVFISSIAGYQPFEALGVYSVSKTALIGLSRAAAVQLASENIQVNCVAPGIIKTKFSQVLTSNDGYGEETMSGIPMKRFGEVDDISGVVAFLVSNDANYITGEVIVPAGGMQSRL
ncbi:dehydrogenase/reductase SDR family member 4-like [Onthophagus taurus]|uniref:dehydrogenase/reductase SDR family member 4-like n=1 Tax=Onthophagus taurus TaxID=166361 RepID=UPI000C205AEF|nr:dehydrogenase/reductase SDR family member 4-like [Onthophagus taurus]